MGNAAGIPLDQGGGEWDFDLHAGQAPHAPPPEPSQSPATAGAPVFIDKDMGGMGGCRRARACAQVAGRVGFRRPPAKGLKCGSAGPAGPLRLRLRPQQEARILQVRPAG
eukprot:925588-Prorocentrum_minimum.AAC.1